MTNAVAVRLLVEKDMLDIVSIFQQLGQYLGMRTNMVNLNMIFKILVSVLYSYNRHGEIAK